MEDFIREDTIVEDAIYSCFKESVTCPICSNILINPLMCMNCQNVYCKKCIDGWSKKDNKCPNRCENPNYKPSVEKNNILSKLKFKCQKCGEEILYDNVKSHIESCKPNDNSKKNNNAGDNSTRTKRLKKLNKKELDKLDKKQLARITSKKNEYLIYFLINIVITLGCSQVGKSSLIDT